ncbi:MULTISPECIES: hypothetical protein [unclassified Streptomyces]|jgi:hypothetical protein|uniref:hypothetical protein n=1 Tax=unclassified Streptomyces TaxID=2593676 RepID=UPI002473FCEB|nr:MULTISPECIES: hypothetical protein [unclassified Streptomyces]MDH6453331.1 hypothetical protein [Streptomyces sp. SAI-119]MDH6496113.1 hypothetical protein [Streptomyces sp. SAI-149]
MAGPTVRRGVAFGLGALWWWAVARLVLAPDAGALEGAVAAGGWGLSLLPVHCVPKARAAGAVAAGRWRQAWRAGNPAGAGRAGAAGAATTASPPRRSGGGSGPS